MFNLDPPLTHSRHITVIGSLIGCFLGLGFNTPAAIAQVIPDGSLSTTVTSTDSLNFVIKGGNRAGGNLFHSFEHFSVPTNGAVQFDNAIAIDTIISRVTGNEQSDIDGLIQANGTADLFLLNPNGFLFGPNARLDIGGSFLATTAESILFENNLDFRASDRQQAPLLSISTPIGLQLGQTSGAIELNGSGHKLVQANVLSPIINTAASSLGLEVESNQALVLIGHDIRLNDAVLTAPNGQVELGAVTQGRVAMTTNGSTNDHWRFSYEDALFGDIQLSDLALVDVSDTQAGSINIQANSLVLNDGAAILSQNAGPNPGGDIVIQAHDSILINGPTEENRFRTALIAETFGDGLGSSIRVNTPILRIRNGGRLGTSTLGPGTSGNIEIRAEQTLQVAGGSPFLESLTRTEVSTIQATGIGGTGTAGDINIQTQNLKVKDGALIASSTLIGDGNSGNIFIQADSIELTGNGLQVNGSGISSATLGNGDAGTVTVNTRLLTIQDGNIIDSSSVSRGNAGNLFITASGQIRIEGIGPNERSDGLAQSQISSEVVTLDEITRQILELEDIPTGNAGNIRIRTPDLRISDGAAISLITEGTGNAGELNIKAHTIALSDRGAIAATTTGSGGNIVIDTNHLSLDNGLINASTTSTTPSDQVGSIRIQARAIDIIGTGREDFIRNTILPAFTGEFRPDNFSQGIGAFALGTAQAGNIEINTKRLRLQNGGIITSSAFSNGTGGNIQVEATDIEIVGSVLTTSTFGRGNAGNINVETQDLFFGEGGEFLSATFGDGDAGDLSIQASGQVLLNGRSSSGVFASGLSAGTQRLLSSETEREASGAGGNITVTAPLLMIQDGAEISASATTINFERLLRNGQRSPIGATSGSRTLLSSPEARAGNVNMDIGTLILDNGTITVRSEQRGGGNVVLDIHQGLILDNGSAISTQAGTGDGAGGNGGNITITAPFLVGVDNSDIVANAFDGDGGNIQITTEGLFDLVVRDELTDGNDITASSQSGISGTVRITTPDIDPSNDVVILPTTITDTTQTIATTCNASQGSRFVITGQGGLPVEPDGEGDRAWTHILPDFGIIPEPMSPTSATANSMVTASPFGVSPESVASPVPQKREATAMAIAPDGSVQLTSGRTATAKHPETCNQTS